MKKRMTQLLDGVRVVDISRALAGPFCTRLMTDLGADVIKIEPPWGDQSRTLEHLRDGRSGYFIQQNAGKKGIALDLNRPEGKDILLNLVEVSDVLIENYRPGVMDRLGLDYETLQEVNPALVMCSISAFGQYGPLSERRGADYNIQALSGMMWLCGEADGPPMWTGNAYTDVTAGAHAFGGIMSALFNRLRTGQGEHIDIALLDCAVWHQEMAFEQYLFSEGKVLPHRAGSARAGSAPVNVYRGRDAYVVLAAMSAPAWDILTDTMEMLELRTDSRFATPELRAQNQKELDSIIEEWVGGFESVDDLVELLLARGLVCGRVRSIPEVVDDPQLEERDMWASVMDPGIGEAITVLNTPFRFHDSSSSLRGPAPLLGEHTTGVLCGLLGHDPTDVLGLIGSGVLVVEERALLQTVDTLEKMVEKKGR